MALKSDASDLSPSVDCMGLLQAMHWYYIFVSHLRLSLCSHRDWFAESNLCSSLQCGSLILFAILQCLCDKLIEIFNFDGEQSYLTCFQFLTFSRWNWLNQCAIATINRFEFDHRQFHVQYVFLWYTFLWNHWRSSCWMSWLWKLWKRCVRCSRSAIFSKVISLSFFLKLPSLSAVNFGFWTLFSLFAL